MAAHEHIAKDGFRLRGIVPSRVDSFSDVVFGFALTLLVVSLEVPRTFDELSHSLRGFFPFAVCFFFLLLIWIAHLRFFRRYGLHDIPTIWINSFLLFAVLFYVYPLKFLFSVASGSYVETRVFSNPLQPRHMMEIYGVGFATLYFALAALYFNAWRLRHHLNLNPLETMLTLSDTVDKFGIGCVGLICAIAAHLLPPHEAGNAGWFFFLIAVWSTANGFFWGPRIKRARAATSEADLVTRPRFTGPA